LLLGTDRDAVVAAGTVLPDDALAQSLDDRVGPALVWFARTDDGKGVYLDLWPDIDLSVSANVQVGGCNGPLVDEHDGTLSTSSTSGGGTTEGDADADSDADSDTDGGGSTSSTGTTGSTGGSSTGCDGGASSSSSGSGACDGSGCNGGTSSSDCGVDTC